MPDAIYTIGHSTHPIGKFIDLLKSAHITALGDVRSHPYSRMNPQFNRETLKSALGSSGIKYVFLGKELGARSDDPHCYRAGKVQYDLLSKTDLFIEGISRVKDGSQNYRIALMCAEKEPLDCHRTILVARELAYQGLQVNHILADGSVESHEDSLKRLIDRLHITIGDMFISRDDAINQAYAKQAEEIAYSQKVSDESIAQDLPRRRASRGTR